MTGPHSKQLLQITEFFFKGDGLFPVLHRDRADFRYFLTVKPLRDGRYQQANRIFSTLPGFKFRFVSAPL